MNKNKKLLLVLSAASLLSACVNDQMNNPFSNMFPKQMPMMGMMGTPSNSQIVGDLVALNQNEINASKLARTRAECPQVKAYANFLLREHTKNLNETVRIAKRIKSPAQESPTSQSLTNQGKAEAAELSPLSKKSFDLAYMTDMVNDHRNALQLLDNTLIPSSTNPQLTMHLKATRKHVALHLQKAESILSKLKS